MALSSYTAKLKAEDVSALKVLLEQRGFEFGEKPYAHYSAKKGKLNVTVYEKGPKVLVQGKETEDFVRFILEPEILGEAKLGNEELLMPDMFEPHFGIDESGKGDYFGPLVIAGVYVDKEIARSLMEKGITDSKKISSDKKIAKLAAEIRSVPGIAWEVISLKPETYNDLYSKFGNVNRMLAWGHAKVICSLVEKVPSCPRALSDQFAREEVLQRALAQQGLTTEHIHLEQRTKGESDVAVAAASILAREAFVDWIQRASAKGDVDMPLGANAQVIDAAREIVSKYGQSILPKVVKTHFKTTQQL